MEQDQMNEITLGFDTLIDLEKFLENWKSGAGIVVDTRIYLPQTVNITMTVPIKIKEKEIEAGS